MRTPSQVSVADNPPEPLAVLLDGIPHELKRRPQWGNWRYEERGGKPTKVPYTPGTNRRASSTDLMTWRTFEEAAEALDGGRFAGVGFFVCSADPFVGIDLDDCRDRESGQIAAWAQKIIDSVSDRYVEASPSGTGVHIITRGVLKDGVNTKWVEVYGQDRFFAFTGVVL
jgi:putative DNA primase/helicase